MKRILTIGSLMLVLVAVVGCATMETRMATWGTFVPDETVTRNIQNGNLSPDMKYYFSGPASLPLAIIGIRKEYELDNKLWIPIKDVGMCLELVKCMQIEDLKDNVRDLHGYIMKALDGKAVGGWYSDMFAKMFFRMGQGNKVIVYTPNQPQPDE